MQQGIHFLMDLSPGQIILVGECGVKQTHGLCKFLRMQTGKVVDWWPCVCFWHTACSLTSCLSFTVPPPSLLPWPLILFSTNRNRISQSLSVRACPQSPSLAAGISPPAAAWTILPLLGSYSVFLFSAPTFLWLLWDCAIPSTLSPFTSL